MIHGHFRYVYIVYPYHADFSGNAAVSNHTEADHELSKMWPPKELSGPAGRNNIWVSFDAITFKQQRLNTGGQYTKAFRIPFNRALMPLNAALNAYTRHNFEGALLNFRLLLKLGAPSNFGVGGKSLSFPPPPSLGGPGCCLA